MFRFKAFFTILMLIYFSTSCKNSENETTSQVVNTKTIEVADSSKSQNIISSPVEIETTTDSTELTSLVRKVYKWHMSERLKDFPYEYKKPGDTIFVGIDWSEYNRNIDAMKETKYFSAEFFSSHKTIASNIDSSIRKADIKWRNINDGIPLWDTNADDWCACQDYPDKYWEILIIDSLIIVDDLASFHWTWNITPSPYPHQYKVTAKKVNGKWSINSLEGFNYYGTVDYYDTIMKE